MNSACVVFLEGRNNNNKHYDEEFVKFEGKAEKGVRKKENKGPQQQQQQ